MPSVLERGIKKIWDEMQKAPQNKKIMLMEAWFEWVRKYSEHIKEEWKSIINLIGKFNRSKMIKKDQGGRKNAAIVVQDYKAYLYHSYVEHLISKTPKFHLDNLISFLRAFLSASKE